MDKDDVIRQRFDRRRPALDVDAAWAAFERRRSVDRRTRRLGLVAAVLVVVLGAAGVVVVALGNDPAPVRTGPSTTSPSREPDSWRRLPSGPLSARSGASAVWTGTEVIVAGGTDAPPCPPNAQCAGGDVDDLVADGAAYDPVADRWRPIAPAPAAFDHAATWWTGSEMLVVVVPDSTPRLLAYDPVGDRWSERAAPPVTYLAPTPVWTGAVAVFAVPDESSGIPGAVDRVYDPASDRWSTLPADPLGCSYDRTIVATGDSLALFGIPCPGSGSQEGPPLYEAARFDLSGRVWHRLPGSDIAGNSPCWVVLGDLVVNPTPGTVDGGAVDPYDRPYPTGGVLHLDTDSWSELAELVPEPEPEREPEPGASVGSVGPGTVPSDPGYLGPAGAWVAAGTVLYEPITGTWHRIPPGPDAASDRAVVWTGQEIIAWGGTGPGHEHHLDSGVAYTPPLPPSPPAPEPE
jgi:hypothetical protein